MAKVSVGVSDPRSMWHFEPSLVASAIFLVLFAITTIVHVIQAFQYRLSHCWVIVMSGLWQTLTYIFRTASIQVPGSYNLYAAWFVLILVAPLWTNAFVYMLFGQTVWNFTESKRLGGLKAQHFGVIFVVLDIVAFAVQVYGAAKACAKNALQAAVYLGLHIYMAGVGIQLFFILIFAVYSGMLFHSTWRGRYDSQKHGHAYICLTLLAVQVFALLLIAVWFHF